MKPGDKVGAAVEGNTKFGSAGCFVSYKVGSQSKHCFTVARHMTVDVEKGFPVKIGLYVANAEMTVNGEVIKSTEKEKKLDTSLVQMRFCAGRLPGQFRKNPSQKSGHSGGSGACCGVLRVLRFLFAAAMGYRDRLLCRKICLYRF